MTWKGAFVTELKNNNNMRGRCKSRADWFMRNKKLISTNLTWINHYFGSMNNISKKCILMEMEIMHISSEIRAVLQIRALLVYVQLNQ